MKRIVFDFDDTIAYTVNRDWENATPNTELIEKIHDLYYEGWQIDIFTARGSLSCKTREEASIKYRAGIEKWLKKHNVQYHTLSFDKPLATYYVDDKGITPEDFISLEIQQLKGGLSGSDIYTDGKLVHKVDEHCHKVAEWMSVASFALNVFTPKVVRVVGSSITMEYIHHNKEYFKHNTYRAMGTILSILHSFKSLNPIHTFSPADYCNRIQRHIDSSKEKLLNSPTGFNLSLIEKNLSSTFAHGDFGITNLLFSNAGDLYLIDPITHSYSSYELDCAKLCASLLINGIHEQYHKICYPFMLTFLKHIDEYAFMCMIVAELIRVHKYHPDKTLIPNLIKNHVFG